MARVKRRDGGRALRSPSILMFALLLWILFALAAPGSGTTSGGAVPGVAKETAEKGKVRAGG